MATSAASGAGMAEAAVARIAPRSCLPARSPHPHSAPRSPTPANTYRSSPRWRSDAGEDAPGLAHAAVPLVAALRGTRSRRGAGARSLLLFRGVQFWASSARAAARGTGWLRALGAGVCRAKGARRRIAPPRPAGSIVSSVHSTAPGGDLDTVSRTRFSPKRRRATLVVVGVLSHRRPPRAAIVRRGELAGTRPSLRRRRPDALSMAMAGVSLAAMPFLTVHLYFYGNDALRDVLLPVPAARLQQPREEDRPARCGDVGGDGVLRRAGGGLKYLKCTNDGWSS